MTFFYGKGDLPLVKIRGLQGATVPTSTLNSTLRSKNDISKRAHT